MPLATILVEDSETIRSTLIPAMEELAGLQVVATASTQEQGLRALAQFDQSWRVAVIDLFLAEGSGLGVLRGCEHRAANQVVIVLTNYATAQMRQRCLDMGADRVFDKSTEIEEFFSYCQSLA
jgi:DNA-binding NarL/FixJ family response regulator